MPNQRERKRKKREREKRRSKEKKLKEKELLQSNFLQHGILKHPPTIAFIRTSNTLVLLRGLPGSGKSSLAKAVKLRYPDAVICSADDYFMTDGEYQYDRTKIKDAHIYCQEKADMAMARNVKVVVIDNTNVKVWETRAYTKMALKKGYSIVVLEPNTPWSRDPQRLSELNSHGVTEEVIRAKLSSWDQLIPYYFGWFLNLADSGKLRSQGIGYIHEAMHLPGVENMFKTHLRKDGEDDPTIGEGIYKSPVPNLHCTARFIGGSKEASVMSYVDDVAPLLMGKSQTLKVIGFCLTPRTLCVRLKLTKAQEGFYKRDDPFPERVDWVPSRFNPTQGRAARAHLTLGVTGDNKAVQAGIDLIEVIECELEQTKLASVHQRETKHAYLRHYGKGRVMIYLKKSFTVQALFTGSY